MKNKKVTNIHVERARHKVSQEQLAKGIGTTRQSILSIESGECIPSTRMALKIARFLKCTVEDLFSLKKYEENGIRLHNGY